MFTLVKIDDRHINIHHIMAVDVPDDEFPGVRIGMVSGTHYRITGLTKEAVVKAIEKVSADPGPPSTPPVFVKIGGMSINIAHIMTIDDPEGDQGVRISLSSGNTLRHVDSNQESVLAAIEKALA